MPTIDYRIVWPLSWIKGWGSAEWSASGAILSAVIAIAALGYAWKSNQKSEQRLDNILELAKRSADAAEGSSWASRKSADAATRALSIQEEQHQHSRMANLFLFNAQTYIIRPSDHVLAFYSPVTVEVKNIGGAEAIAISSRFQSEVESLVADDSVHLLTPTDSGSFTGSLDRAAALRATSPCRVVFRLEYQDISGKHEIEADIDMTFVENETTPATILSMTVDGEPSHQYHNISIG